MTEIEAYYYLGSAPCDSCDNCNVDENFNTFKESIKPRHCKNGYEMIEFCRSHCPCSEEIKWEKEYNKLVKKTS